MMATPATTEDLPWESSDYATLFNNNDWEIPWNELDPENIGDMSIKDSFENALLGLEGMDYLPAEGPLPDDLSLGDFMPAHATTTQKDSMAVHLQSFPNARSPIAPDIANWEDNVGATTRKPRGPQPRLPNSAKAIFEAYFANNPYPTRKEYELMAKEANVEIKRIRTWFSNARARRLDDGTSTHSIHYQFASANPSMAQEDNWAREPEQPERSLRAPLSKESLERLALETQPSEKPPLETWMDMCLPKDIVPTAGESRQVSMSAADPRPTFNDSPPQNPSRPNSLGPPRAGLKRRVSFSGGPASIKSARTSMSGSAGSAASRWTSSSRGSHNSSRSRGPRRGRRLILRGPQVPLSRSRRRQRSTSRSSVGSVKGPNECQSPWFCTFCGHKMKSRYEWIRHEESVHVPRATWVCCSVELSPAHIVSNSGRGESDCVFGIAGNNCPCPSEIPLSKLYHRWYSCIHKPEEERTFFRRDQFIRHLHNYHLAKQKHPDPDLGCMKGSNFGCAALVDLFHRPIRHIPHSANELTCGFCGQRCLDWESRIAHVALHFTNPSPDIAWNFSDWWSDRLQQQPVRNSPFNLTGVDCCLYCGRVVGSSNTLPHASCRTWSCRYLTSIESIMLKYKPTNENGRFLTPKGYRSYRSCDQRVFATREDFVLHLQQCHGATMPSAFMPGAFWEFLVLDHAFSKTHEPMYGDSIYALNAGLPEWNPERARASKPDPVPITFADPLGPQNGLLPDPSSTGVASPRTRNHSPRFFRALVSTSPALYYLKHRKGSPKVDLEKFGVVELSHGHVGALTMVTTLLGMACLPRVPWPPSVEMREETGLIEFGLKEEANLDDDSVSSSLSF
ncbi:hypothetical protein BCR34DRAFT_576568 [Clohesyomyces aquaticus]|uniref:Homeobox domain-containing protein n=1 Tax=Clohesyomyces aquaticus TaxID=1231657 RepID=A0A1Y1YND3_9PLEO|nr:hypothetical protein BCR34DRAFT_576568 [Clohesyomyces aquaticus]